MVRSPIRWDLVGGGWLCVFGWSTWDTYDNEAEAFQKKLTFMAGGVVAGVVHQSTFDDFCRCHKIV